MAALRHKAIWVFGLLSGLCLLGPAWAYLGEKDSERVATTGCNAASYAPVPGTDGLFVGRQFFKPDNKPVTVEEKCASPGALEAIKGNRWGIVLDRFDWHSKTFSLVTPLLVPGTSINRGPAKGATVKAAYDPDAELYHGHYWLVFECILEHAHGVDGTSSCMAEVDMKKQELLPESIHVVVSGVHGPGGQFDAASVPELLMVNDRLYMYWSALTVQQGKFVRDAVRGAELEEKFGFFWVKGTGGNIEKANGPNTVEVWGPTPGDKLSDTAVDLKSIWLSKSGVVALVGLGGSGCAKPGPEPGCFRMAMAKSDQPLGDHIFNKSPPLDQDNLPTNPQGYTRPIKNPAGGYSFVGDFFKPTANGFSERRPVPKDWSNQNGGVNVVFPFADEKLWPVQ
jgi:hypothetical protein